MHKLILFSISAHLGLTATSALAEGYIHPLQGTVSSLREAAAEADAIAEAGDADIKAEATKLRARAGDVAAEALVAPVTIGKRKISELGYDIKVVPITNVVERSKNFPFMQAQAYAMNPSPWRELGQVVEEVEAVRPGVLEALKPHEDWLTNRQFFHVYEQVDINFRSRLTDIQETVARTLSCIDYFSRGYAEYGLIPVETNGHVTWSASELLSRYGVSQLAHLPPGRKAEIARVLAEWSGKLTGFRFTCASIQAFKFIREQYKILNPNPNNGVLQ